MSCQPDYLRLCRLIHESLGPYSDSMPLCLSKDTEKHLLIQLSQVYTNIKQWTQEFDSDYDNDIVAKPVNVVGSSILSDSHSDDHRCLIEIIGNLMALLAVENPFIQHLTGNTLVAISEFVVEIESGWEELMRSMCHCLKLAIDNMVLSCSPPMAADSKTSHYDVLVPLMPLKLKLKRANLSTAAAIVRVLRDVLKLLKQDFSDQNFKVYLDSICSVISDIPWDFLNEVCIAHRGESVRGAQPQSINMFQANLLQIFCSVVDKNNLMESGAGSVNDQIVISAINNAIPKLLAWCLREPENSDNIQIFHYFRHKILMLLIRLSSQIHLDCSALCSWLNLIHQYFQDLLLRPITSLESEHHDCLEGSPFWLHAVDTKRKNVSPCHLQRLAVFFFLKCSFSLISLKEKTCEECACINTNSFLNINLNTNSKCGRRRGLLELHKWLQGHLPADIYEDSDMYSERCASFSISFLQLYMHEDDILFEMLLQLFCLPVYSDSIVVGEAPLMAKDNMFVLISDIFNPIHMFHSFLSEIHYDHQVLLDYLISKDSGVRSAEYLLRSLRIICDSWNLFVEFPGTGEALSNLDQKRRKVSANSLDFEGLSSTYSVTYDKTPSVELNCTKSRAYASNHRMTKRLSFEDAKECLFSLQTSIESLNQKGLFPYNPQVLSRRLTRFQELCQAS